MMFQKTPTFAFVPEAKQASDSAASSLPESVSSQLVQRIRKVQRERGLAQGYVASGIGFGCSFLSAAERGEKPISLPSLEVMALGMSPSLLELLGDL